jgi:intracellular sulfur oxidation DsrE/DsrF family protein
MKHLSTLLLAIFAAGTVVAAANDTGFDDRPIIQVPADGRYRVVYDMRSDRQAAGINKGLYYVRGLIEAFRKQGVKPDQLNIHVVMHGRSARALLLDEAYQAAIDDPFAVNPNAKIVGDLIELGVSIEICHSAMKSKGWSKADVLPDVAIVHDGYTRLIKLQNDGYAYIGGF